MFSKQKLQLIIAEFMGTAMLASAVLVAASMFGSGTAAWYVSITAGVALAVIVGVFGHISGAHVNPAVTIGMWTLKKIPTENAIVYIAAQMLGGATALLFFNYATGETLPVSGAAAFSWNVFWVEVVGSALFGMGIVAAVSQKLEGYYASFVIGLSLTFGALVASAGAAGFLNPAVALANNAWNRTYAVAPIIGMVIGMNIYMTLLAPSKETAKSLRKK